MGWAARYNYRMWLAVWTGNLWARLRALSTVIRSKSVRSWLRGSVWAWLTGSRPQSVEQRRLQAIAAKITSKRHLDLLLKGVHDVHQRKALRDGLKPYLRF